MTAQPSQAARYGSLSKIIDAVESGKTKLLSNIMKGNYGELKMDQWFLEQGYSRVSLDSVGSLKAATHQGIDGVYFKAGGHPPYVVAEAKYGTGRLSKLKDGTKQMSKKWVDDRLQNAISKKDLANMEGEYGRTLFHVDPDGSIKITDMTNME